MLVVNKRVDLVNIASSFRKVEDLSRPPMGLLYVGSVLKKQGYDVRIYHISRKDVDVTCKQILERRPLFVGFSCFTGPVVKETVVAMRKLKALKPEIKIIWGGIHPSLVPNQCLEESAVDFVCVGEGEVTVVEFAEKMQDFGDLVSVKGIGFKENGNIIINPGRPFLANMDEVKLDWSLMDDLQRYVRVVGTKKIISLCTSRGCPHNCTFCYNQEFNKRKWRFHSIDYVIEMVRSLKDKIDFNTVTFDDDNFFTNKERAFEIIRLLKEMGVRTDWVNLRFSYINSKFLDRFNSFGVKSFFAGYESANARMLRMINKDITPSEIIEKVHIIKEKNDFDEVGIAGIIGLPTETWEEVKKTIAMALRISKLLPNANLIIQTYLPYPGTELYPIAVREGFQAPKRAMDWEGFDVIDGNFRVTWLKGYPFKDIRRRFFYISKYTMLLSRFGEDSYIVTMGKRIFHCLAYYRLKHQFFWFPWEIYFYDVIAGWIIRKRRKGAFPSILRRLQRIRV